MNDRDELERLHSGKGVNLNAEDAAFRSRISELIEDVGSAPKLGKKAGLTGQVIRKYAAGESDPSRKRLISIAQGVGVCLEWLMTGEGPKYLADRVGLEDGTQAAVVSQAQDNPGFLDPDVVLKEAEFILDAFSSLQGQVTPAGAASALIDRVRERMRLMRENEEQEGGQNGKIRA